MRVLSRKMNESIFISGNIQVTVLSIRGNQVRLGIIAPREVEIFREELQLSTADIQQGDVTPMRAASTTRSTIPDR